jgi:hypothetical protein
MLVGDRERDRTVAAVRRAYAAGYIDEAELERRAGVALGARTPVELVSSVRGVPGGLTEVAFHGVVRPALRHRTFGLRVAVARFLMKLAVGAWTATTVILAAVAAVWALAASLPLGAGLALAGVWLAVSGFVLALRRGARRLLQP